MADFSVTLNDAFNLSSPAPTNKWGVMTWGVDNWGTNNDLSLLITKVLEEGITAADEVSASFTKIIQEALSLASSLDLGYLADGSGYKYVDQGVTDPDDRLFPSYTEGSDAGTSWTDNTDASTSWSEA